MIFHISFFCENKQLNLPVHLWVLILFHNYIICIIMIRDDLTRHCQILHLQTSSLLQYYQTNFWLLGDYTSFMESLGAIKNSTPIWLILQYDSYLFHTISPSSEPYKYTTISSSRTMIILLLLIRTILLELSYSSSGTFITIFTIWFINPI